MNDRRYGCIVADPPWPEPMGATGLRSPNYQWAARLPYPTMTLDQIRALPVHAYAKPDTHLWLWTTNHHLRAAFAVMEAWGFRYLTTITWTKPNGIGMYFTSRTQHCLFGYREVCRFPLRRFAPNHIHAPAKRHSEKPEAFYELCETVSPGPRLELFARRMRFDWDVWGNEVYPSIDLAAP